MPQRPIHISESTEKLLRELAEEGESISAAMTRLIETGADAIANSPRYVGIGAGSGDEFGRRAEEYLGELAARGTR